MSFLKKKKMWNGFVAMALPKQEGKKIVPIGLWQRHCRNRGEKNVAMNLWQWHCRNRRKKIGCNWFVAMALPKQRKKKMAIGLWQWHC